MPDCPSIDPLVTPYVDGELPAAQRERVARHLGACPRCQARVQVEQTVRDLVHARLSALRSDRGSALLHARCAALRGGAARTAGGADSAARPVRATPARWRRLPPFALAAALVLVVAGASLYQVTESSAHVMVAELAADHVKCFLLQDLIGTERSVRSIEYALTSKFGWPARLPERPDRAALELLGERTCLYGQGRVAHILYRHEGRPVSLFMLPGAARQDQVVDAFGHSAAIWSAEDRTFVLIAREPREGFDRMARFVRTGLH
jgi:anti-sigma factor RsiW